MAFFSPRIAPGISTAMARVAERFYLFGILLVASTIYLPHRGVASPVQLLALAGLTVAAVALLHVIPWDNYRPRLFTLFHVLTSSSLLALLVSFTGGIASSYGVLFFLVILFSYFYNILEMLAVATAVSLFYLLPLFYDRPSPQDYALSAVMVLFFYLGTYVLYGVTRFVLKRNATLTDLNGRLADLYDISSDLFRSMERTGFIDALSERLKDHLPSTYCIVLLLDDKANLITRVACPLRTLRWEPALGSVFAPAQLRQVREVLETRQPRHYQLDIDRIDPELYKMITRETKSVLIVPIRIAAENAGVLIFGEERRSDRAAFTNDSIQLAVAISRQVAVAVNLSWCYERLILAQHNLRTAHDTVIKAERLSALGEVTRAVEHEVNNPLNVILNWSDVYREDPALDPEMRKSFQAIYSMAIRIGDVVTKLSALKDMKAVNLPDGNKMTDLSSSTE